MLKVIKKQPNSSMCFICGLNNNIGLKTCFFELENRIVASYFNPQKVYQSYPDKLHGGISVALLDELMARAIMPYHPGEDILGVTLDITAKFRKPIALDNQMHVFYSEVISNTPRFFSVSSKIILPNKKIAVEATGKYIKVSLKEIMQDKIKTSNSISIEDHMGWKVYKNSTDPQFFDINL